MCLGNIFSIALSTFTLSSLAKIEKADETFKAEIKELGSCFFAEISAQQYPFISVLIPARNEERLIERCVRSILDQSTTELPYPENRYEVIVGNDWSSDKTPQILMRLQAEYGSERLKIINNPERLSESGEQEQLGWLGKSYALHVVYQNIDPRAELVLFMDADARLKPGALRCSVSYTLKNSLGLFSLILNQNNHKDFWFRLLRAELLRFYSLSETLSTELLMLKINLENRKTKESKQRERLISQSNAVGSFMLFSRKVYEEVGGHYAVRLYMRDDVQFAKLVARHSYQVELKPGEDLGELTPNQNGLSSLWISTIKTIFMSTRKNWIIAILVICMELLYHLFIPSFAIKNCIIKLFGQKWKENSSGDYSGWNNQQKTLPTRKHFSILFSLATLLLYILTILRTNRLLGISPLLALFQPVSTVVTCVMMIYSGVRTSKGLTWKGRKITFNLEG